jgi:hypothetical protein
LQIRRLHRAAFALQIRRVPHRRPFAYSTPAASAGFANPTPALSAPTSLIASESIAFVPRLPIPLHIRHPIRLTGNAPASAPIGRHGILARMAKRESEFEKLARLIKEEGEDIRTDVRDQIGGLRTEVHDQIGEVQIGGLRKEMHEGFAAINRRLDQIIQMQLDEHAARIKKLETAVFSK